MKDNYKRMMEIIDQTFATRNDPNQLQVTAAQMKKLQSIHKQTLAERSDENGPVIWVLMIPTVTSIMKDFLEGKISEKEILDITEPGLTYDCIYLCSATTLPEYRGKGETKKLCVNAVNKIKLEYPISTLFFWSFTVEGDQLAEKVAETCNMRLLRVQRKNSAL